MPILTVSSADRDKPDTVFTGIKPSTPMEYEVTLATPITSAFSVDLMYAMVPKTIMPLVGGYNMTIDFSYGVTTYSATLFGGVDGVYTPAAIVAEISDVINIAVSLIAVSTAYDPPTNLWSITEVLGTPFSFSVQTSTPMSASLLGISYPTPPISNSGIRMGSIDLSHPKQLKLEVTVQNRQTDQAESRYGRFSYVMPMLAAFGHHAVYRKNNDFVQAGPLRSIGSIDSMKFKWSYVDPAYDGLLDFGGADHVLEFSVLKA